MSVVSIATIKTEIRNRLGDVDSTNYFVDDTALTAIVNKTKFRLVKYYKNEKEDATTTGDGGAVYDIPDLVIGGKIKNVWVRTGDETTDREVRGYRSNAGKIYLPFSISSGTKLVYWYSVEYSLGTDDIPNYVLEVFYSLIELGWYDYALARRSDFEQWAASTKSDARIGEIASAKRVIEMSLNDLVSGLTDGIDVEDAGGGI